MPSDKLAPVETVFVSEILLSGPLVIDVRQVVDALAKRKLPTNPARPWNATATGMERDWPGGFVRVAVHATPLASAILDTPIADASGWWPGARVRKHTHVARVEAHSKELSAAIVAHVHVRLTAAILDTARDDIVLGVLWSRERLYPGDFVQAHATEDPSLGVLMGVHVGKEMESFALRTSGLSALGLMNFEVAPVMGGDLQAMAEALKRCVSYLVLNGPVIRDGDTIGNTEEAQMRITHRTASWGGETVYHLAFIGGVPDGLQAVTCPQCGQQVRGKVLHFGPLPMLESCPKCGVGPIALLQQMVGADAEFADDEVDVIFETSNAAALTRLLADYDVDLESPAEAAEYVRENYARGAMSKRMPRSTAELVADAAEDEYPDIRVRIDD